MRNQPPHKARRRRARSGPDASGTTGGMSSTQLVYDRSPRTRSARVSCLSIEIEIEIEISIDMGGLP